MYRKITNLAVRMNATTTRLKEVGVSHQPAVDDITFPLIDSEDTFKKFQDMETDEMQKYVIRLLIYNSFWCIVLLQMFKKVVIFEVATLSNCKI